MANAAKWAPPPLQMVQTWLEFFWTMILLGIHLCQFLYYYLQIASGHVCRSLLGDICQSSADHVGGAVLNGLRNSLNLLHGKVETLTASVATSTKEVSDGYTSVTSSVDQYGIHANNCIVEVREVANSLGKIEASQNSIRSSAETASNKADVLVAKCDELITSNAALLHSNSEVKGLLLRLLETPTAPPTASLGQHPQPPALVIASIGESTPHAPTVFSKTTERATLITPSPIPFGDASRLISPFAPAPEGHVADESQNLILLESRLDDAAERVCHCFPTFFVPHCIT